MNTQSSELSLLGTYRREIHAGKHTEKGSLEILCNREQINKLKLYQRENWNGRQFMLLIGYFLAKSCLTLLWSVAHQASLSMGFSLPRVGCHALLQGIFLSQGWNRGLLCLLRCTRSLRPLSLEGALIPNSCCSIAQSCPTPCEP